MSIELKQAAQQVLDAFEAFGEADDFATLFTLTRKMNVLRAAIQQAESEPCKSFTELRDRHREGVDAELAAMEVESGPVAKAWAEGYRQGVEDERISEANIGIAGFCAKVNPNRENPYGDTHPAPGVPEFSRIAKRKLDELQEQGFAITGYAIQRAAVRGFIDGGGFVGWWQGEPAPGVPDDVVRDADRLDWLARNPVDALDVFGKSRPDEARFIRATIDAAMTAAQAQKGQP